MPGPCHSWLVSACSLRAAFASKWAKTTANMDHQRSLRQRPLWEKEGVWGFPSRTAWCSFLEARGHFGLPLVPPVQNLGCHCWDSFLQWCLCNAAGLALQGFAATRSFWLWWRIPEKVCSPVPEPRAKIFWAYGCSSTRFCASVLEQRCCARTCAVIPR